ncbi:MAG: helix-turn-helix transcriptional regulator [Planctomycetes bacterium]|nr:helix-turn-helix transcriptional regulator [Planctomycetota bacterium]
MAQFSTHNNFEGTDAVVLEQIGQRVASARLQRNITQQDLAKEAGVSRSTVKRLEAGESTQLTAFIRVLRVLDLLAGLDLLLPAPRISPLHALKSEGQKRQRASSPRSGGDGDKSGSDDDESRSDNTEGGSDEQPRGNKVEESGKPWSWGEDA